jgi:tetratricopeptide (TPR) repeat protein
MHQDGYELYRPQLAVSLAEGLAKAGQLDAALSAVREEIAWVKARDRVVDLIDLLCVKGKILSSMSQQDASEGLACLLQALEVAQQRGLLSLELRSGIILARLWADRGEADRALELLEPIFSRFSEGFQTLDLMAAAKLLAKLRSLLRRITVDLPVE